MNKPFTHNEIDFVIKVDTLIYGYEVTSQFYDGRRANDRILYITFENSDLFKEQHGYPGVEQAISDQEDWVKQGNYFGSPFYQNEKKEKAIQLSSVSGVEIKVDITDPITYLFSLRFPDGSIDSFTWSTASERSTNPGLGGPLTQYRNEALHAFWSWERNFS